MNQLYPPKKWLEKRNYPIPIFPTRDGGCLVAGRVNSAYELGSLSKIDKNGNLAWSRQSPIYQTGVYDAFRGIYVDENSDILAVGTGMQLTGKANLLATLFRLVHPLKI